MKFFCYIQTNLGLMIIPGIIINWFNDNTWYAPRLLAQQQRQGFLVSVTWVRASTCASVTPVVSYLSIRLAGCSVDPGISYGARKLVRTSWLKKK